MEGTGVGDATLKALPLNFSMRILSRGLVRSDGDLRGHSCEATRDRKGRRDSKNIKGF